MKSRREWVEQEGIAFLEVLFGVLVLGIAVIGVSLMLSRGQTMVVGQGDRYVALYLAQQKIESLTASAIQSGFASVGTVVPATTEPPLQAGEQAGTALQSFTRTTCINYVKDDDPTTPSTCANCAAGGTCTNNTKRITVTVTPAFTDADPVTLTTVITAHP